MPATISLAPRLQDHARADLYKAFLYTKRWRRSGCRRTDHRKWTRWTRAGGAAATTCHSRTSRRARATRSAANTGSIVPGQVSRIVHRTLRQGTGRDP